MEEENHFIQSILFPKEKFTLEDARSYLQEKNLKYNKVDHSYSTNYYRFRQYQPRYLKERYQLDKVKSVKYKKSGIIKIIFYK